MTSSYAHFIGIGGAGMSGIARVLHDRGLVVTGSDLRESRYSSALRAEGIDVRIGHDAANLGDPDVVVTSTAIPDTNPELVEARRRGLPVWPRARMLAELAGELLTVAVAGTHGKTTTSSLMAAALAAADQDPTFLIGGELTDVGSNAHSGTGPYFVVEADESDRSFLYLDPFCAIVTNIEADHLDHYGSLAEIVDIFEEFLAKVRPDGVAVLCADDQRLMALASACRSRVVTYGRAGAADVRMSGYRTSGMGGRFTVDFSDGASVECSIRMPGIHMALNATGVLAGAWALGIDVEAAARGIAGFGGVKRRFEHVGEAGGVEIIDDYAHHPTEVRATLAAARAASAATHWVVFQPHRYSRTAAFAREFGAAFDDADRVVILDVYGAGEAPVPGVSGKTVVDAILRHNPRTRLAYFPHRADVARYVADRARPGDMVMTMGAGDITTVGPEIVRTLTEGTRAGGMS